MNEKLEETTNNLTSVTEEKDSMSFLGIMVSKSTYNTILWSVMGCLLVFLLFFIYKFRNSNVLTQEAKPIWRSWKPNMRTIGAEL
ncbi:hypothetical protein Q2T40_21440 [Winogradskyella maritima]|nr:hypothetical protein [Winogradskyella maritima]